MLAVGKKIVFLRIFFWIEKSVHHAVVCLVSLTGIGLVLLIGLEVFFRYVVGRALSWPEEVAGIMFVWFTIFGVVLITRSEEHVEFTFLLGRMGSRLQKCVRIFAQSVICLLALAMIVYGYRYAEIFGFERTPAAGINIVWLNAAMPVGGSLILFYSLRSILKIFYTSMRVGD